MTVGRVAKSTTVAERLAGFCRDLTYEGLPPAVREAVPYYLLDFLANAIGGNATDTADAVDRFLRSYGSGGPCTVIGRARQAPAAYAALANGIAAHCLETDDTHRESSLHPGAAVFPAALAAAEMTGCSPQAFAAAVVAGYEVTIRLGAALGPRAVYDRGFHPTGICGVFGAAAAAGHILGLPSAQLAQAFGIAGSMTSGSMEFLGDGSWTKRLHPGWAAHAGLTAALLAQSGFTGPVTIFEGPMGFLHAHSHHSDAAAVVSDLGREFQILRTSIKAHACCRFKQGPIDAVLALVRDNDLKPQEVRQVTIGVLEAAWNIIVEPDDRKRNPVTVVDAQFSMPYGAAVALARGRALVAEYQPAVIADPAVRGLMARVRCVRDPSLDARWPGQWPATVAIETTDGRRLETRVDYPKGDPENPLTWEELVAKFHALTEGALPPERRQRVIEAAAGLYQGGALAPLLALLVVA